MASEINLERHQRKCSVCRHEQRDAIEADFISWRNPAVIADAYGLADRSSIYRHAEAYGLQERRRRNIRAALERIIERADGIDVTASAVVSAVQAYSKINATGEWVDRTETVSLNDMFNRMTTAELEAYASTGVIPAWFPSAMTATASHNERQANDPE